MNIEYRKISEVRRNKDDDRTTVVIKTDALDTYNTVIDPAGGDLSGYNHNPVVLFNHDPGFIVGRSNVRYQDGKLIAEMADDDWDKDDPEAMRILNKVKNKFINMASIGFGYKDEDVTEDEADGKKFLRINKWKLMEWSWVTMAADPGALVISRSAERDLHDRLDEIQNKLEKLADRKFIEELLTVPSDETDSEEPQSEDSPQSETPSEEETVVRETPTVDPAMISQIIERTIKQKLGKA